MPRRSPVYSADAGFTSANLISSIGSGVIAVNVAIFLVNVVDLASAPGAGGR